jgi:alkanesulfonate monooxygenase SsuD/methylene tetrahydromethanopterin reductase-like flavin-dependent oxidoreductase (luciferase family)
VTSVEIGLYIEAQEGVTWQDWRQLAQRTEALGFDSLVSSVHLRSLQAPGRWTLDLWPLMTAIALWTQRIRFGPMVLPITFYHPAQIARLSAGVDRLSGGRFRLRLGAGRDPGEHQAFGMEFPEHDRRVDMLGEALEVIRLLWSGEPVSFAGTWYRLEEAQLQPTPEHCWIGTAGDSEPSLRVAASRADEWCTTGPWGEELRQRMEQLDALAHQAGRNPRDIERSVMNGVIVGRDEAELEHRAGRLAVLIPEFAGQAPEAILEQLAEEWQWWVGNPEQVAEQVRKVKQAGVDHIFFQLFDFTDLQALQLLAQTVMPAVQSRPT